MSTRRHILLHIVETETFHTPPRTTRILSVADIRGYSIVCSLGPCVIVTVTKPLTLAARPLLPAPQILRHIGVHETLNPQRGLPLKVAFL